MKGYKRSENLMLLDEFEKMRYNCAEIKCFSHSTANSCASSFRNSIKIYGKVGIIKVIVSDNRVFLIRK